MSDDKIEQEQKSASTHHELSETPFGSAKPDSETPPERPEGEAVAQEEKPAEQPEAEAQAQAEERAKAPAEEQAEEPVEAEAPMSMEEAMAVADQGAPGVDYSGTFKSLAEGDVVDGVVVHIDREGVLVDVGTKSEGSIKPSELSRDPGVDPEDVVAVGDKIRVYVVEADSQDGGPVLSKKRADFENAWERVQSANTTGELLKAMVTDRVKGGLVVDLGIRGFVPASHVGSGRIKNLEKFVGQSMPFKVIEVDRERRKVVLSNRLAVEEEREGMRKATLGSLTEGQIRDGVVRRLTNYGAFVDLGGVDGLLHISEMSWTRINHPSEAVGVGQKIQVMILKLNLAQGRVSLGLRQILPDPWVEIRRIHSVGEVITGTVSRLVPFGAFVQVEGGVEGIIPNSELAVKRVNKPEDVVSVGQEVEVKVLDLRPEERRMTLSLRQLQSQKARERDDAEFRGYTQGRPETKTTIGDIIGDQLGDLAASVTEPAKKTPRRKSRGKAVRKEAQDEADALAEVEEMVERAPAAEEPAADEVVEVQAEVGGEEEAPKADVVAEEAVVAPVEEPAKETKEKAKAKAEPKKKTRAKKAAPKAEKEKKPKKPRAKRKKPEKEEAKEEEAKAEEPEKVEAGAEAPTDEDK